MARDWWQGNQGAPTTGYGSFDARPAAPEPMLDALIDDETPLDDEKPPEQKKINPNQGYIDMLQRDLLRFQNQYASAQANGDKRQMLSMQQAIVQTQGKIREAQLKAQQGGY